MMEAALIALASDAGKQLIANPYQAAQIPSKFITGYIDGLKGVFEGAWDIKDRTRTLQLTFVNLSGKDVSIVDTYFDSGAWYQSWNPILKGGMICQGTVANKQGSLFTGVTGGMMLKIQGQEVYIHIGFTNPYTGSYKNFVEMTNKPRTAQYAYERSENNYPKNTQFGGYRMQVVQTPSSITQMAFVYEISPA